MSHDFRLGTWLRAKSKDSLMWGIMWGVIGGIMWGPPPFILRPDLLHRNRGKRNHGAEHIALDKLRGSAGIELRVFVSIPHPGPQLICQPDLPEHFGDGRLRSITNLLYGIFKHYQTYSEHQRVNLVCISIPNCPDKEKQRLDERFPL